MRTVSFYDTKTGLLNGNHMIVSDDSALALNTPEGHAAIDGHHDPLTKRIDVENPEIVDVHEAGDKSYAPTRVAKYNVIDYQPPAPSADHVAALAKQEASTAALAQIAALDFKSIRAMRELALGKDGAAQRLASIEAQIVAHRANV